MVRKPPRIQGTTWAIFWFFLIQIVIIGLAVTAFAYGHWGWGVIAVIAAFMVRIGAINDGPHGNNAIVVLSLAEMRFLDNSDGKLTLDEATKIKKTEETDGLSH